MAPVISKDRQSASPYPFLPTQIINLLFFVSTFVTAAVLCYFTYYLRQDGMAVPLELIFPLVVSILTLLTLSYQFFALTTSTSSPRRMLTISVPRLVLWCASFGLTTWKLAPMVLTHACTITLWQTDMGVMVCRVYKAYYAFTVISWVCSIATLALDVKAGADTRGRGAYEKMGDSGSKAYEPHRHLVLAEKQSTFGTRSRSREGRLSSAQGDYLEMKDTPDLAASEYSGEGYGYGSGGAPSPLPRVMFSADEDGLGHGKGKEGDEEKQRLTAGMTPRLS